MLDLDVPVELQHLICSYLNPHCNLSLKVFHANELEPRDFLEILHYLFEEFKSENYGYLQDFVNHSIFPVMNTVYERSSKVLKRHFHSLLVVYVLSALEFSSPQGLQWINLCLPLCKWDNRILDSKALIRSGSNWLHAFLEEIPQPLSMFADSSFYYCLHFNFLNLLETHFYQFYTHLEDLDLLVVKGSVELLEKVYPYCRGHSCALSLRIYALPPNDPSKPAKLSWIRSKSVYTPTPELCLEYSLRGAIMSGDLELFQSLLPEAEPFLNNPEHQIVFLYTALKKNQLLILRHLLLKLPIPAPLHLKKVYFRPFLPYLVNEPDLFDLFSLKTNLNRSHLTLYHSVLLSSSKAIQCFFATHPVVDNHDLMRAIRFIWEKEGISWLEYLGIKYKIYKAEHIRKLLKNHDDWIKQETRFKMVVAMMKSLEDTELLILLEFFLLQNQISLVKQILNFLSYIPQPHYEKLKDSVYLIDTLQVNKWKCCKKRKNK